MPYFATNYASITEEYFKMGKYLHSNEGRRPIVGIHIFKWDPKTSYMKVRTIGGTEITYKGNALVEGAVYYVSISEVIEAGPSAEVTEIHGIISTFKQP